MYNDHTSGRAVALLVVATVKVILIVIYCCTKKPRRQLAPPPLAVPFTEGSRNVPGVSVIPLPPPPGCSATVTGYDPMAGAGYHPAAADYHPAAAGYNPAAANFNTSEAESHKQFTSPPSYDEAMSRAAESAKDVVPDSKPPLIVIDK